MNDFAVWTINPDSQWVAKNSGIEWMLLHGFLSYAQAMNLKNRLYEMYGDPNLSVQHSSWTAPRGE